VLKKLLLIGCCLLCAFTLRAQSVFNGRVFENKTRITLHAQITNLNNNLHAITGADGRFSIGAKPGDLLVIKAFSYQTDTLLLTDMHDKEIFLASQTNMLKQVIITDSSGKTGNASKNMLVQPDQYYHGQVIEEHRDQKGMLDGGMVLRVHYFTADDRKKKKASLKAEDIKTNERISEVFSADNISRYLPLKGEDMTNFLLLYTPDIATYKAKSFNLLQYLNASYKEWGTLTPEQKKLGQVKF
jgi:hypothetical protein